MQLSHRGQFVNQFAQFVKHFGTAQKVQPGQLQYRGQNYSAIDSTITSIATDYQLSYRGVRQSAKSFHAAHRGQPVQLQYRGTRYAH